MTSASGGEASTGDPPTGPGGTATTASPTTTGDPSNTGSPTTGDPGSSGDTNPFVAPPDLASARCPNGLLRAKPSTTHCDVWEQDCPPGEKCAPYDRDTDGVWDTQKCVPIFRAPAQAGEPCTVEGSGVSGIDSCDCALLCWNVDAVTLTGTCVPFCDGTPDEPTCPPGTACLIEFFEDDLMLHVLTLCLPSCDPLAQDCPDDGLCVPNSLQPTAFVCVPDRPDVDGQAFAPCNSFDACDEGLFCADPTLATECDPLADGCCLPFCDTTMPACPGATQQCLPWYEMNQAPPGLDDLGLCAVPQ